MSEWSVADAERNSIVSCAASGLSVICFSRGRKVAEKDARAAATDAERKAYNRAKVESKTTTGARPKAETEQAYLRILSQNIIDFVKHGGSGGSSSEAPTSEGCLDLSSSGREFLTEELAITLLEPMLKQGSTIKGIKFSTKSIGSDAAPVVVKAIGNVAHTLEDADVSDIIAGRPEAEVLQVIEAVSASLSKCQGIKSLNISDNALGEKGIRAFKDALTGSSTLQALYLKNIGCSVNACKAVAELVGSKNLKLLHLFNNMSDNEGASAIASLLQRSKSMKVTHVYASSSRGTLSICVLTRYLVEDFSMVSSRVGLEGGVALCAALSHGTSLESIDLSDNPMEPAIGKDIAALAVQHKALKRLVLNDLCMGDEGTALLCGPLSQPETCPQLEHVELSLNEISRESTPAVARMLASKRQTLKTVVLSENELECAGAIHVAAGLQRARALQELNLSTNMIGRVGALAVAKMCASAPKFQMLTLNDNVVSEEGVEEICALLKESVVVEDNDPEGDPEEDVLEDASAEVDVGIDLQQLTL